MSVTIGVWMGVLGLWILYLGMPQIMAPGHKTPPDYLLLTMGGAAVTGGAILIHLGSAP